MDYLKNDNRNINIQCKQKSSNAIIDNENDDNDETIANQQEEEKIYKMIKIALNESSDDCIINSTKEDKMISNLNGEKQQSKDTEKKIVPLENNLFEGHCDIDADDGAQPLSERWSPVGANYEDPLTPSSENFSSESDKDKLSANDMIRLKSLEEEQEFLTTSLLALTSHFAHVQLRVRQIVEAPIQERDQLLKDLNEFAFRGIRETPSTTTAPTNQLKNGSASTSAPSSAPKTNIENCYDDDTGVNSSGSSSSSSSLHQRQFELIEHLKSQLIDLEKYAYESGAPVLPQHMLLEKQKIIIDELKQKLNFRVDEQKLPELSTEELKNQVDNALGEFVGPFKMKEQLVAQLKTQITDLERFIAFLQCDTDENKLKTLTSDEKISQAYNSYAVKSKNHQNASNAKANKVELNSNNSKEKNNMTMIDSTKQESVKTCESLHNKAHGLMDKASVLMQIFASTHFTNKSEQFQKNTLKRTYKGNHWGDLRAQLEMDIQEVSSLAATLSFDRAKLVKMQKLIKASKLSASNGIKKRQLKSYHTSSDSEQDDERDTFTVYKDENDNDDDNDDDDFDSYDIIRMRNRRLVQCADYSGDSINTLSNELTAAVRKNFSVTLMQLIQHGLRVHTETVVSTLMLPFLRCLHPSQQFATEQQQKQQYMQARSYRDRYNSHTILRNMETNDANDNDVNDSDYWDGDGNDEDNSGSTKSRSMHAWELILEYYYLKHGDEYNNTPARKLSQSFNLEIVDSKAITPKQTLLSAVGAIITMHRPYKRSYNAHFKAFICAGLNSHQLVDWLNLIFNCKDLVNTYYTSSSYVACTGFRDALHSIDALTKYDFNLPVDFAIRHFRNL